MDDDDAGLSSGYAFHLNDIILHLSDTNAPQDAFLSESFATELVSLDSANISKRFGDELPLPVLEEISVLGQDASEWPERAEESDVASSSPSASPAAVPAEETPIDIWTLDPEVDALSEHPRLRTWEGFRNPDAIPESHVCLSEAGPMAFNAAILRLPSAREGAGVLPQDVMLRSLCSLAVGRASVFFQWDASKGLFQPTLRDIPMSGYSLACHESFVSTIIDCGSKFRTLADYGSLMSAHRHCASLVAFKGCVANVLDVVERSIAMNRTKLASMLQLQKLVDRPHKLLDLLTGLSRSLDGLTTDEAIISKLSDEISAIICVDHAFAEMLQQILARVSGPWLRELCADLGMDPFRQGSSFDAAELVVRSKNPDESLSTVEEGHDTLDAETFPSFVHETDRALIRHIKASLKVLRRSVASDPTAVSTFMRTPRGFPAPARPLPDFVRSDRPYLESQTMPHAPPIFPDPDRSDTAEQLAWATDDTQQGYLAGLADRMIQVPASYIEDPLQSTALAALDTTRLHSNTDRALVWQSSTCDPLESIRPLIRSHAHHVTKALLRHLFHHGRLLDHLTLLHQHFLFGNGVFVDRLATALFNTDIQSAQRKRGTVPTGTIMGLRLGTSQEQQWPPASSAVQLALMGILAETYTLGGHGSAPPSARNARTLPGGLSFSIRELSESEIEQVIDPTSVHALDFLKLQYTPPAPLDSMLTRQALKIYDDAFRFLLKLLRMLHVTTKLREKCCTRQASTDNGMPLRSSGAIQFATEAHHFVSTLMTYCLEVGAATPWAKLVAGLQAVEGDLVQDGEEGGTAELVGLEHLRHLHQSALDSMRSRLLLRRKYGRIGAGVEEVFAGVLKGAVVLEGEGGGDMHAVAREVRQRVGAVIALLQGAVDRPAKSAAALDDGTEEDVDAMRLLLLSLDWNGFYGRQSER